MQQPAVSGVNRDAGMAPGVSRQRDHHDARRYLDELLGRSESAPLLTVRGVLDDLGSVGPLDRAKAKLLPTRRCLQRSERLPGSDVDLGIGKIGDAADVVAVEVSNDDVAHVITAKAKLLNLIDGGSAGFRPGRIKCREGPPRRAGSPQSFDPKPLSISTRPLSVSTSSTWQTISPHPNGYMVPQLRW